MKPVRQFFALLFTATLSIILISHHGTQAQTTPQSTRCSSVADPTPIVIPFNEVTDGKTVKGYRQQSNAPCIDQQNIVGNDDRLPVISQQFPWSAIGRLDIVDANGGEFHKCTGTLIGRDLVLTNSHCLFSKKVLIPEGGLVFKPNLIKQNVDEPGYNTADRATVISYQYGWKDFLNPFENKAQSFPEDWALLKLDKPLGDKYGYLGWRSLDLTNPQVLSALKGQVRLAGYSSDFPRDFPKERQGDIAGAHLGCSIEQIDENGRMIHDCDTMAGSSGSSIIALFEDGDDANYYIIGLNNAESSVPLLSSQDNCETIDRQTGDIASVQGGCANLGVQVARWSAQAALTRLAD
jgi:V8-like Glu-specific endopeptidase